MKPKGLQELREHVPDLRFSASGSRIFLLAFGIFSLTTYFYIVVNRYLPIWGPDGQIIITFIGFLLMRMFFTNKNAYIHRCGELAYRNAFLRFVLPGLMLIFASLAYTGYIPGPNIPIGWWAALSPILGWYFLIIGVVLWVRSVFTFGLDNLTMLYVYFPEESRRVDNGIYEILRHPIYAAALRLGISLALLNGNIFALIFGLLVFPFGLITWMRLVEERELIERFGKGYLDYRKATRAFWPRPSNFIKFFRFLVKG